MAASPGRGRGAERWVLHGRTWTGAHHDSGRDLPVTAAGDLGGATQAPRWRTNRPGSGARGAVAEARLGSGDHGRSTRGPARVIRTRVDRPGSTRIRPPDFHGASGANRYSMRWDPGASLTSAKGSRT